MADKEVTTFQEMYDYFVSTITDDFFLEMTETDINEYLEELLTRAIPHIEFPKWKRPLELDHINKCFYDKLTEDEKHLVAEYMKLEWIELQISNIDLIRQKYTSSDFELTSQASHLRQLINLRETIRTEAFHLQRLINRRIYDEDGNVHSSFGFIMQPVERSGTYAR